MPRPEEDEDHSRIPVTRFRNSISEFLDLATRSPIVLTSHGRETHVIVESAFFRRLERPARASIPTPER